MSTRGRPPATTAGRWRRRVKRLRARCASGDRSGTAGGRSGGSSGGLPHRSAPSYSPATRSRRLRKWETKMEKTFVCLEICGLKAHIQQRDSDRQHFEVFTIKCHTLQYGDADLLQEYRCVPFTSEVGIRIVCAYKHCPQVDVGQYCA